MRFRRRVTGHCEATVESWITDGGAADRPDLDESVLADDVGVAAAVSAMTDAGASVKRANSTLLCYQCNQPNHLARDCLLRQKGRGGSYGGRGRGAGRSRQC